MARNEEKAQSMLSRYLRTKEGSERRERRPYLAALCDDVDKAEKWRLQVLSDIRRFVSDIQNAGLDETEVRELNDKINKLLRERGHWERRIVQLGGKNHYRGRKQKWGMGDEVFEHEGYFYFGEAKNLTGVRELLETEKNVREQVHGGECEKAVERLTDAFYYGYKDDVDGEVSEIERRAEEKEREEQGQKWEETNGSNDKGEDEWDSSYLNFVGKIRSQGEEDGMHKQVLEKKKVEALEQLQLQSRQAMPVDVKEEEKDSTMIEKPKDS